jgi:hypothetical protein
MPKLLKLSFFLSLFLCLSACNESPVVEFYSYHELMEYDFFSNGWFPGILKEDAFGIKETYDVTSRHAFGKFEFKQRELYEADLKDCPTVAAGLLQEMMDKIERPSLPQWFVPKDSIAKGHYLLVKHGDFYLIAEKSANRIYFFR